MCVCVCVCVCVCACVSICVSVYYTLSYDVCIIFHSHHVSIHVQITGAHPTPCRIVGYNINSSESSDSSIDTDSLVAGN